MGKDHSVMTLSHGRGRRSLTFHVGGDGPGKQFIKVACRELINSHIFGLGKFSMAFRARSISD
jgi:hypothetical protein